MLPWPAMTRSCRAVLPLLACLLLGPSARAAPPFELSFDDQSDFHGDGERIFFRAPADLWLERIVGFGAAGSVRVELYRARLSPEQATPLREAGDALLASPPKTVDRLGIPDEVRDKLELRSGEKTLRFEVWQQDWAKQPKALREALTALRTAATSARQKPPARSERKSGVPTPWPPKP